MMAHLTTVAITPQLEDNFLSAVGEFQEQTEQQVNAIAPDPSFDYIHAAHRDFATAAARQLNQNQVQKLQIELDLGRELVEAKERLTRRGEFSKFKRSLSMTLADARKYIRLAITFGEWQIDRILAIASATNIYTLCAPKFANLVEKLNDLPVFTSDLIKQMVKEARPPRKPKQQPELPVDWQRDASGGGRHLKINLYDDDLAVKIKSKAEERQITAQEAIADAFLKSELVEQALASRREAVDEVREAQVKMQRQLIQKDEHIKKQDERIKELESKLSIQKAQPRVKFGTRISLDDFDTWEEFAGFVSRDASFAGLPLRARDWLLATVKDWNASERQSVSKMLANFLEAEPQGLDELNWIPDKLLSAAMQYLSFKIQIISGGDNLVDDPIIEIISSCKFVSVRDFGTKRECWVFQLPNKKNVPIFGREQFQIERF